MIGVITIALICTLLILAGILASEITQSWYGRIGYWVVILGLVAGIVAYAVGLR